MYYRAILLNTLLPQCIPAQAGIRVDSKILFLDSRLLASPKTAA